MSGSMIALFMPGTGAITTTPPSGTNPTSTGTSTTTLGVAQLNPTWWTVGISPPFQKALIALVGATMIGSTSPTQVAAQRPATQHSKRTPQEALAQSISRRKQAVQTTASQLSEIKSIFGFSVTQLACVLQVTRQIVYKWLDEQNPHVLQAKNRDRVQQLYALASDWRTYSKRPIGKYAEAVVSAEGETLLDLLSADQIDEAQVRGSMIELAKHIQELGQTRVRSAGDKNAVPEALTVHTRTVGTVSDQDT